MTTPSEICWGCYAVLASECLGGRVTINIADGRFAELRIRPGENAVLFAILKFY